MRISFPPLPSPRRTLAAFASLSAIMALLSACSPKQPAQEKEQTQAHKSAPAAIVSTAASLGPFDGPIAALAFAPVKTVPWEGRVVVATTTGGLTTMDVEGHIDSRWDGPAIKSLAISPDFNLRGLSASMVLAIDEGGTLHSLILDDARGQLIAAPVEGLDMADAASVCALPGDTDAPRFLISRSDARIGVWQISDSGEASLQASQNEEGKLAIALAGCAATKNAVFGIGAKGGLLKLLINDKISIDKGVESAPGLLSAISGEKGVRVLISDSSAGNVRVYDDGLEFLYTLTAPKMLSTPGSTQPGAMAMSTHSFGGAGFSAGLLAVADNSNQRVALIVLDTIPTQAAVTAVADLPD